ncbi:conserved hypothetical protein [Teredinibacter turnerae T7901]|uniref:Uncharacterized protein n=1 Tax=Teredinibacter turnerae (strain ATCC 39867 / T7901) TaxID=377629 RepID=C5BL48_TERTT|nr:DUF58 domain-containing protein [Teredinibacter turnerae]ACR11555.1 conserved hypothetical protein [Teredinibacter turnerae T7901]
MFRGWIADLQQHYEARFFRFIDKRVQSQKLHRLTRDKLYIFPSKRGLAFIGLILLLWLIGTNYQNNLILALAFLLSSIMIVTILQTHANLNALELEFAGVAPVHAGELAEFTFTLRSTRSRYVENIEICWQDEDEAVVGVDVAPEESVTVTVPSSTYVRGWHSPARMRVQTFYPLGILRCWTWLNWDVQVLVYPAPIEMSYRSAVIGDNEGDGQHPLRGGQDYHGLRPYVPGDGLRRVSWKHLAQEKGLFVKDFSQSVTQERWLDIAAMPVSDLESQLAGLCYWALRFAADDDYYGLRLGNQVLAPDKGVEHTRRVLNHLAVYGL